MSKVLTFTEASLAIALDNVKCFHDLGAELIAASVFADHSAHTLNMVEQVSAALKGGQVPFAIECGLSNGDGTYSVHIKRYPLPSYLEPHKDHPVRLLYTAPPSQASAWVPEGWKLVPVEPTPAMLRAGAHQAVGALPIYRAMLASAPTPGASDGKGGAN